MAAPMELCCWGDGWGLPSPHPESLIVMAYAKFSGAPLTVNTINNSWRALKDVPVLISEDIVISQPAKILNFLRKQKYNADYELSAKQGADTLAFIALLEEKLLPALLHTFWVDAENYCSVTKPWFTSRMPFPLGLYLPGKISRKALNRILLTRGAPPFYSLTEVEAQVYRDAKECLNLLSKRLGTSQFFFGDRPTTLDAFVFGFLAPIYKVSFPRVQLQKHLKHLPNLCRFCDDILTCYFRLTVSGHSPAGQDTADANLQKLTQLVNKESNLIEKKNIVVQVRIPTEEGCLSASVHSSKGGGKCLDQNSEMVLQVKMDDNLRKSPQHPPRKLTTLKLAAGGEQSSPLNRLSP